MSKRSQKTSATLVTARGAALLTPYALERLSQFDSTRRGHVREALRERLRPVGRRARRRTARALPIAHRDPRPLFDAKTRHGRWVGRAARCVGEAPQLDDE